MFRISCEIVHDLSGLSHYRKGVMSTRIIAPENRKPPETHASSGPHVILSAYEDGWLPGAPKVALSLLDAVSSSKYKTC
jgi:hypothetical protein